MFISCPVHCVCMVFWNGVYGWYAVIVYVVLVFLAVHVAYCVPVHVLYVDNRFNWLRFACVSVSKRLVLERGTRAHAASEESSAA